MSGILSSILDSSTEPQKEHSLPTSPVKMQGRDEPVYLYDALAKLLLATHWGDLPDSLTKRQYVRVIEYVTDGDSSYSGFNKAGLKAICDHLGIHHSDRPSTRVMRERIAKRLGFKYDPPSSRIRSFRKEELKTVAKAVIRKDVQGY